MKLVARVKRIGVNEPLAIGGALVFLGGVAWIFAPAALILGGVLGMSYAAYREISR